MFELVPIETVSPSTYNPRSADAQRLDLVELSLRKLGFVLPIFVDAGGEVLSGHQRHLVATRIGCRHVPVAFTKPFSLAERKAINVVFNRATNDFKAADTSGTARAVLADLDVVREAAALPDLDPTSAEMFPCLQAAVEPLGPLLQANAGRWNAYATSLAGSLYTRGIVMPIVVDPDSRVVNGIGRLEYLAQIGETTGPVLRLSADKAPLAEAMLNLLSMDFDVHTRYRDLLRHNSFRRSRLKREYLGLGFTFAVAPNVKGKDFDVTTPANARKWKALHGSSIVDFGAGHLHETEILRGIGCHVAAFEPFRVSENDQIDPAASVALAREFLADVASGRPYSSIFISSVLNSVPFDEDRRAIVTICAALCGPKTRLFAAARSTRDQGWQGVKGRAFLNEVNLGNQLFALDYEPGITLGSMATDPKVQKFHTAEEFYDLFKSRFAKVSVRPRNSNVEAIAAEPLPTDRKALAKAFEFEFDLPYPDGYRMGLVDEAKSAFSRRLGVKI